MTRIQPMSADSARAVLAQIKGNIASISIKSLDGLTPAQAATLERLLQISEEAQSHIVEGKSPRVTPLQLPAEDFGVKNQSDWEGRQVANRIRSLADEDWHKTAMVVAQKRPDTKNGVAYS